jgi:hypothetical protein
MFLFIMSFAKECYHTIILVFSFSNFTLKFYLKNFGSTAPSNARSSCYLFEMYCYCLVHIIIIIVSVGHMQII